VEKSGKETQNMYLGRYYHTIEQKGRVAIPVRFRQLLGDHPVMTRGLDGCLFIFSQEDWITFAASLEHASFTKRMHRDFIRLMTHDAEELTFDDQGRVLIPEFLRESMHLSKDIVFAGSSDHIELWDRETYHTYIDGLLKRAEDVSEQFEIGSKIKEESHA
jgi:MraZ protein